MLYNNSVYKDTLLILKGWGETVKAVQSADLSKIKNANDRQEMYLQKQVIDAILKSKTLREVVEKTAVGAKVIAIAEGRDPGKVPDPGKQFAVTDENGKRGKAALPADWVRSLCGMYTRGLEQVPIYDAKAMQDLEDLISRNPADPSKPAEKLDTKEASEFLKLMKACNVSGVADKADPVSGDIKQRDQLNEDSMREMKSVYGRLPDLAGSEQDPEVKAISSEYGPAPTPPGGGGGGGSDPDPETTGAND